MLDMYSGASLLRTLYINKPLLYYNCLSRLIILISFNFWSVVTVVSGKSKCTAFLCREFDFFLFFNLRTYLHLSHKTRRIINVRFNVGIEEQFSNVDVYDVPSFRQETQTE